MTTSCFETKNSARDDGLAVDLRESQVISMMLKFLNRNRNSSHCLVACVTGFPGCLPINCKMPSNVQKRVLISERAMFTVAELFPKLKLRRRHADTAGVTDVDYGSHQKMLCFSHNASKQCNVGELSLGEYENSHHIFKENSSENGLTNETNKQLNLLFCQAVVKSMCAVNVPHPMGYIRINPVCGAMTTPHTDNMRGPTVNLVNFHSANTATVNARLMVRPFPAFKTSVVQLHGNLFVPFQHTEIEDSLVLIGPGRGSQSHLPEDCKHQEIRDCDWGSVTFFNFPAKVVDELAPYGHLNFAVLGLKKGFLQTIPFLCQKDPAGMSVNSSTEANLVCWVDALQHATANRQPADSKESMPKAIGNKANFWHQFYAWRFIHWFEGDPMVPRTHVFFRFVRENNTSGCLRVTHGKANHVDKH